MWIVLYNGAFGIQQYSAPTRGIAYDIYRRLADRDPMGFYGQVVSPPIYCRNANLIPTT